MPRLVQLEDCVQVASAESTPCPLDRLVRGLNPGSTWAQARRVIQTGKVWVDDRVETDVTSIVRPGQRVEIRMRTPRAHDLPVDSLIYVDRQVIVVRKPPGISTVPYDPRDRGTLEQLLERHMARKGARSRSVLVVHRLDKETSGLLVFARTREAQRDLKHQFRLHTVTRQYVALAEGRVAAATFRSRLVTDRGDGRRGSTSNPRLGREAITHVRPLEFLSGASLLECRLETGRTHQIRIHLSEAGHPLLGERVYSTGDRRPRISAPRLMLHARELGFRHPTTQRPLFFEEAPPADFTSLVESLRHSAGR